MSARKRSICGYGKKCRTCPYYTANGGGQCTRCLNLRITKLPAKEPKQPLITKLGRELGRRAEAVIRTSEQSRSLPAAVLRGMSIHRERGAA